MPSSQDVTSPAFRRLSLTTAVTSLVVIAVGGATRATDSGLACPTWPGCFTGGDFLPPITGDFVDGLGRNVTGINIWLEHSHRLVAGVLGLMIAALLVMVLRSHRRVGSLLWPTVAMAVLVNVQASLGALVVWNLVRAELVTLHLGLGTLTMALTIYLAVRARRPLHAPAGQPALGVWRFAVVATAVLWAQLLVGGHLSGVHGGLAYKADPLLGVFSVGPITVEPEAVNVLHRYLAYAVAGLIMAVAIRVKRTVGPGPALRWARIAGALTVLQVLLGAANLYTDLSFVSVIPHLVVASWILGAMVMVCLRLAAAPVGSATSPTPRTDPALEPAA